MGDEAIFYLHGFASSPRGRKVTALRELFEKEGRRVLAPDLNVPSFERLRFEDMVRIALGEAHKLSPGVVVGSSLGALVALGVARRGVTAPLVLVAPAIGFGDRWAERLPAGDPIEFFHHGEGRPLWIHRAFFEELAQAELEREPPAVPVTIVMGKHDESIPFDGVSAVWRRWEESGRLRPGSRFVEIPEGDHGLIAFTDRIAEEIRARLRGAESGSR